MFSIASIRLGLICGTIGALLLAGRASAAEAVDQAGADRIRQAIESYTGAKPFEDGFFSIVPDGDAYVVKAYFAKIVAKLRGTSVDAQPFVYRLRPMPDGRYGVTSDNAYRLDFSADLPTGPFTERFELTGCKSEGIFDPAMHAFSSYSVKCGLYHVTAKSKQQDVDLSFKGIAVDVKAKSAGAGRLDVAVTEALDSAVEDASFSDPHFSGRMKLAIGAGSVTASLNAVRYDALLDLVALIVRHDGPDSLKADRDAIEAAALKALPLHDGADLQAGFKGATLETPAGTFGLGTFSEHIALSGLTKQASASIGFAYDGLQLPPSLPDIAKQFIPTQGQLEFAVRDIDADGLSRLAIQKFDPSREPRIPAEAGPDFLKILTAGAPHFLINPSSLTADDIDLKFEGDVSMLPTQAGKVTLSAAGYDKLRPALSKSGLPGADKAALGVAFVQGLAKTGPDGRLIWVIDFDTSKRSLTVNGTPLPVGPH